MKNYINENAEIFNIKKIEIKSSYLKVFYDNGSIVQCSKTKKNYDELLIKMEEQYNYNYKQIENYENFDLLSLIDCNKLTKGANKNKINLEILKVSLFANAINLSLIILILHTPLSLNLIQVFLITSNVVCAAELMKYSHTKKNLEDFFKFHYFMKNENFYKETISDFQKNNFIKNNEKIFDIIVESNKEIYDQIDCALSGNLIDEPFLDISMVDKITYQDLISYKNFLEYAKEIVNNYTEEEIIKQRKK